MLGFLLFLAIALVVGTIAFVITMFVSDFPKAVLIIAAVSCLVFSIILFNQVYEKEGSYYEQKGNPKTIYAQVQSKTSTKISVYTSDRRESSTFTLYNDALKSSIREGDVVKIVYVDGIYRAFALNIEKYVPATQ